MAKISSGKKPDRRIAKTQAALGTALFDLMQLHDWKSLTIQQVCDRANVARSSFYAHYSDLGALLDSIIGNGLRPENTGEGWQSLLDWLVEHIATNKKLFKRIVQSPDGAIVFARFKKGVAQALRLEFKVSGQSVTETELAFIIGGIFEALHHWAQTWKVSALLKLKSDIHAIVYTILKTKPQ